MKDFNEDLCMRHSYNLLLGKKTLDELIKDSADIFLMFNPENKHIPMVDDVYDTLIEYFSSTEEYEKCAEILKAKNDCQ